MRRIHFFAATVLLFLASNAVAGGFQLTSTSLKENETLPARQVFRGFGCTGDNISPQLSWQGEPAATKSFAITVYDPDAPTGSGWWHWLVFNIPADVHSLPENSGNLKSGLMPKHAIQARTDFGSPGYGGACPPAGNPSHRYQFIVWALDVGKLPLTVESSGAMLGFNLQQHTLGKAELTVKYGR
ncbi:MAG: YbhB/YbcL family Raf kinase inhibitor-like protein [Desulfosporosinus sp.]|nr:YbhB/YbcL family Raf kinase inhibitor-like protein [Desulfosporosinus sp.]